MDAKMFGSFIADMRKERNMTQKDLAEKLNVTDKAISKWERGLGFPDINTIEPLAEALGVSVAELMKSERLFESEISPDTDLTEMYESAVNEHKVKVKKKVVLYQVISLIICIALIIIRSERSLPLGICTLVVMWSISKIMYIRNGYQVNDEKKNEFRKIVIKSVILTIIIMTLFITITVLYAINRN